MDLWDDSSQNISTPVVENLKPKSRKWKPEQIIALVLLNFIVVGILMMVLAFTGVFDATLPVVPLTPVVTITGEILPPLGRLVT